MPGLKRNGGFGSLVSAVGLSGLWLVLGAVGSASGQTEAVGTGSVWVSTEDGVVGVFDTASPWGMKGFVPAPGAQTVVRNVGKQALLLGRDTARVRLVDATTFAVRADVQLPAEWSVVDGVAAGANTVYVTRSDDSSLWRLDVEALELSAVADLGVFAPAGGGVSVRRMIVVGGRLFVQVQRVGTGGVNPNGVLAVFDAASGAPVDADAGTAGVQGIELAGPDPGFDMMTLKNGGLLMVSCPGGQFDTAGGLDLVDLGELSSRGFVVAESGPNSYAQLGGFAVSDAGRGVFVFHTDLLASSHAQRFSVRQGAAPPPEFYVSLNATSDEFAVAGDGQRAYWADRGTSTVFPDDPPGMHVFHLPSGAQLTDHAVATPGVPYDVAVFD